MYICSTFALTVSHVNSQGPIQSLILKYKYQTSQIAAAENTASRTLATRDDVENFIA